jgi:hypothetical protein
MFQEFVFNVKQFYKLFEKYLPVIGLWTMRFAYAYIILNLFVLPFISVVLNCFGSYELQERLISILFSTHSDSLDFDLIHQFLLSSNFVFILKKLYVLKNYFFDYVGFYFGIFDDSQMFSLKESLFSLH